MLESTTPLATLFTPCPACRDAGKTWHPHGQWKWSDKDPDRITCEVCAAVFLNEKYPETVAVQSHGPTPQTFTFMGGDCVQRPRRRDRLTPSRTGVSSL